jgi:hypothetical protein
VSSYELNTVTCLLGITPSRQSPSQPSQSASPPSRSVALSCLAAAALIISGGGGGGGGERGTNCRLLSTQQIWKPNPIKECCITGNQFCFDADEKKSESSYDL